MAKAKKTELGTLPVPPLQKYKCSKCGAEYSNEIFQIDDERDCPVCDNKDCVKKIS